MKQVAAALELPSRGTKRPARRSRSRWARWIAVAVASLVTIYIAIIAMNWPFKEQAVVDALQNRSLRAVTIGHFYRTYFPPGCTAEDIRFLHRKHKEKAPLITVRKLVLVTTYSRIFTLRERLSLVRVMDMHVTVPPTEPGQPNPVMPLTYVKSQAAIKIDKIIADGAILDFLSKTGKKPYRLVIDKLRLDGVGDNEPISYKTLISNELPPGKIRSTGAFGTWNPKDPGRTPLHGSYTFENANLAAFGGISGTLFSSGSFKGILGDISVAGTANVPNFKVYDTSHARPLAVQYQATVDGTKGDTILNAVTARFDRTVAHFKGFVAKVGNTEGKTASIDIWTNRGRVEDVLKLFISGETAPMSGVFTFGGRFDLPPGPEPFLHRLKMRGDFGVAAGKFANSETEGDLTRLSDSSNTRREQPGEQPAGNVLSNLKGHGSATNGTARLSNVAFAIPGANAWIHGTYGLIDYKIDLHGTLLTTGDPSRATTGFKTLMVKVITPFFKRKHAVRFVPFKITGTYSNVNVGLDLGAGN
ncbi:MAG: hypothetical protein JOZ48_21890 [Acidobacteriaceae bacterium]|nr:hypothetical protein [Acidobacteriaceae bacterium]